MHFVCCFDAFKISLLDIGRYGLDIGGILLQVETTECLST